MFDLTDAKSFDNVQQWIKEINVATGKLIPIIIVGNKSDLPRVVTRNTIEQQINNLKANVILTVEMSVYDNENFETPMLAAVRAATGDQSIFFPGMFTKFGSFSSIKHQLFFLQHQLHYCHKLEMTVLRRY